MDLNLFVLLKYFIIYYLNSHVALVYKGSMYYVPMLRILQHYLVEAERKTVDCDKILILHNCNEN